MAIEFITSKYEFSHGRKPKGHGFWFFEVTLHDGRWMNTKVVEISASGTLSEAKKKAIETARETAKSIGLAAISKITVLP